MPARATLLGVPWDGSSSFLRGAAAAPDAIRAALWSASSNPWNEYGDDVSAPEVLDDAGNLALPEDAAAAREAITAGVAALLNDGRRPLVLGGDHSITYPILRASGGAGPGDRRSCTSTRTAICTTPSRAIATRMRARSRA